MRSQMSWWSLSCVESWPILSNNALSDAQYPLKWQAMESVIIQVFAEDVGEESLLVDICDEEILAAGGILIHQLGFFVGYRVQELGCNFVLVGFGGWWEIVQDVGMVAFKS